MLLTTSAFAAEKAPPAWPRFHATVSKEHVNFRVEPSVKARLAPAHPPRGAQISVQRAADEHWFEILDPDEYRGFFVREDMLSVGAKEADSD
jgi:hypothetical protein